MKRYTKPLGNGLIAHVVDDDVDYAVGLTINSPRFGEMCLPQAYTSVEWALRHAEIELQTLLARVQVALAEERRKRALTAARYA